MLRVMLPINCGAGQASSHQRCWLPAHAGAVPFRSVARIILLAGCLLSSSVRANAAVTFTASLDRDVIYLGETATLSLIFTGVQNQNRPALPQVPNLQIQYLGPSTQVSIINGQMSQTVTHNLLLTPRQPGDFVIPSLTAQVAGSTLTTQPLALKVLKPNAPPPASVAAGEQVAFLKLLPPKPKVYVGETFITQLQLFLRREVQSIANFQLTGPETTDGWLAGKPAESQRGQTQIGNSLYTVISLAVPVKALKPGQLDLGPINASVVVEIPSANRRRDPFFGMFGGGTEQRQLVLATGAEKVQVLPLPDTDVPRDFTGAIGNYQLSLNAGPTNLTAGDPITVKVEISGRGSLETVTWNSPFPESEFKSYPPATKVETTDPLGLQGAKVFEQVIVPAHADIKALPAVSFSFFDPEQGRYQTLTHPAIPLVVRPAATVAAPTIAGSRQSQEQALPTQDIVQIKQRLGTVAQAQPILLRQPWFIALQFLPLLALFGSAWWRRRSESLANNPRLRRQRAVAQVIRNGLKDLHRLAQEKNSDLFFATLFRLLQEQIGERLDLPASAITEAVIDEKLRPMGLDRNLIDVLQDLFHRCNTARYAPVKESGELTGLAQKAEAVLDQLQHWKA